MLKNDSRKALTLDASGRLWQMYYHKRQYNHTSTSTPRLYDLYGRTQKLAFVLKFLLWQTTGDVIHNPDTPATLAADLTFCFFFNQRALTATR